VEKLYFVPARELKRIRDVEKSLCNPYLFCALVSTAAQINALYIIQRMGDAMHGNPIFNMADVATWLWTNALKNPHGLDDSTDTMSDSYFLPATAVPLWHSLLAVLGYCNLEDFSTARDAYDSLGCGANISEVCVKVLANRLSKKVGRMYVILENEEIQGEQTWELFRHIAEEKFLEITVVVTNAKPPSRMCPREINELGKLPFRFHALGWEVAECDGNNFKAIDLSISSILFDSNHQSFGKPQVLVAHTANDVCSPYLHAVQKLYWYLNRAVSAAGLGRVRLQIFPGDVLPRREGAY